MVDQHETCTIRRNDLATLFGVAHGTRSRLEAWIERGMSEEDRVSQTLTDQGRVGLELEHLAVVMNRSFCALLGQRGLCSQDVDWIVDAATLAGGVGSPLPGEAGAMREGNGV